MDNMSLEERLREYVRNKVFPHNYDIDISNMLDKHTSDINNAFNIFEKVRGWR